MLLGVRFKIQSYRLELLKILKNNIMKLTKKEINENLRVTRRNGFGNGFDYNGTVRGFNFETLTDQPAGELMECDDTGQLTYVATVSNKKEVVNAIFEWFKEYASQEFDD